MTRFFYTCPIKAAYMNWYHGIEYTADFSSGYEYHNDGTNSRDFVVEGISRLYIHPDSVGLLEPMEGDIVVEPTKHTGARTESAQSYFWKKEFDWDTRQPASIIQRNGTAFHWPESEE